MTLLEQLLAQANQAAETGPDMTEIQKGGGGGRTLPDGYAFARLVEYVEYGSQPQTFGGVAKDPQQEFQLGFALSGFAPNPDPAGQPIPYANDDGTPYLLRTWSMSMSRNEKAKAYLLFKAMNWRSNHTHFAQMIGEAFVVKIHQVKGKAADAKPKSSIDLKDIRPPIMQNPMTGQNEPYPIPAAPDTLYRLFLWDHPTIAAWNSLKIEGEFEAKDGMPAKSKNYVQNDILGALDFSGSALELLLKTTGTAYVIPPKPVAAAAPAAPPVMAAPAAPAQPTMPAAPIIAPAAPVVATAPSALVAAAPISPAPVVPAIVSPVQPSAASPSVANPPFLGGVAVPSLPAMPVMSAMPAMPLAA